MATALCPVVKTTTVSQLVDELSRFPDAEQWLIVTFASLMLVAFTCWVGFAVILVTRAVLGAVLAGLVYRLRSQGIHQRKLVGGGLVEHATT
jgi:hypothetical protein